MTTKEQILETLHKVIDPELGHDIVEMGMVRDLTLTPDGAVSFTLALTIPSCPMTDHMAFNARQLLTRLPDVKSVDIRFDSMTDKEHCQHHIGIAVLDLAVCFTDCNRRGRAGSCVGNVRAVQMIFDGDRKSVV